MTHFQEQIEWVVMSKSSKLPSPQQKPPSRYEAIIQCLEQYSVNQVGKTDSIRMYLNGSEGTGGGKRLLAVMALTQLQPSANGGAIIDRLASQGRAQRGRGATPCSRLQCPLPYSLLSSSLISTPPLPPFQVVTL